MGQLDGTKVRGQLLGIYGTQVRGWFIAINPWRLGSNYYLYLCEHLGISVIQLLRERQSHN